jgi:hypothetical protein
VPRHDGGVLILRATAKLLRRLGPPTLRPDEGPATLLGEWYATALPCRPQVALLVNERTLLPVLMPLAPAATLSIRAADHIAAMLAVHGVPAGIVEEERQRMREFRIGRTANRSVVGIMTEFSHLAQVHRERQPHTDLAELAVRLARTPCSPLYRRSVSPDRELAALVQSIVV